MKKNKVDVIWGDAAKRRARQGHGDAAAVKPPKGALGRGRPTQAKHIILATGARPRAAAGLEPDGKLVWTYFEAMVPETMPKSLLVVGSGAIGIEFASFYRTLGAEVTWSKSCRRSCRVEDEEIAGLARKRFEKQASRFSPTPRSPSVEKARDSVVADHRSRRQDRDDRGRTRHLGGRRGRQYREPRPGDARREDRPRPRRHRRLRPDQCPRPLRHRRRRRPADAGAQGRARRRHLRRGDRGPAPARHGQDRDSRLHLLQPAGRLGRPDRGPGEGGRPRDPVGRFPFIGNGKAIALGETRVSSR